MISSPVFPVIDELRKSVHTNMAAASLFIFVHLEWLPLKLRSVLWSCRFKCCLCPVSLSLILVPKPLSVMISSCGYKSFQVLVCILSNFSLSILNQISLTCIHVTGMAVKLWDWGWWAFHSGFIQFFVLSTRTLWLASVRYFLWLFLSLFPLYPWSFYYHSALLFTRRNGVSCQYVIIRRRGGRECHGS